MTDDENLPAAVMGAAVLIFDIDLDRKWIYYEYKRGKIAPDVKLSFVWLSVWLQQFLR